MNVVVCCPSYKRPKVETLAYIPYARVYVDGAEYDDYVRENAGADIVRCADGVQGNVSRVRNYIIDTEFAAGADAVVIVDDDMRSMYRFVVVDGVKKIKPLPTDDLMPIFQKYSLMCKEWGYYYWGVNCVRDPMAFMAYTPFSTTAFLGGPFQVFMRGGVCRYDESLPLKEDYDMLLQQCNLYRGCMRVNSLCFDVKQSEQAGGCAMYRNMLREQAQFEALRAKWGSGIIKQDRSNKGKTKKVKRFDYNPIVKVPIKGV